MILLLGLNLFNLCLYGIVICGSVNVAYHTQGYGESVAIAHQGKLELQGVVLALSIVNEDIVHGNAVLAYLNNLQSEAFLCKTILVVLAEHQGLSMLHIDGVLGTACLVVDVVVSAVVEDYTVLHYLTHRSALVVIGCLQNLYGSWGICCYGASKEVSACTKAEFRRAEGVLHCTIRTALADKAPGTGWRILTLGETVDTIVQENHIQVYVSAVGMYEVIAANGKAITVATYLPYGKAWVCHLATCCNGCGTAVYGVHAVGGHIVRQTAGATDAGDNCDVFRCNANLGHSLVQRGEEEVVTTTGAPSWLSLLEILSCICCHDNVLLLIC